MLPEPDPIRKRPKGHAIRLHSIFVLSLLKEFTFFVHSVKPTSEEGEDEERPLETNQMADRLLQVRDCHSIPYYAVQVLYVL